MFVSGGPAEFAHVCRIDHGGQATKVEAVMKEGCPTEARPLDAAALLCYLRRVCRESGTGYEPFIPDEDPAGLAVATVLLGECQTSGADPRTLMQAPAMQWRRFHAGVLRTDDGRAMFLPVNVSFLSFYRWRREISQWIEDQRVGTLEN